MDSKVKLCRNGKGKKVGGTTPYFFHFLFLLILLFKPIRHSLCSSVFSEVELTRMLGFRRLETYSLVFILCTKLNTSHLC